MIDIVLQSIKNLKKEGVRTFLTLIGVVIGIGAIVSLLSVGQGLNLAVETQLEQLGSNTIYIIPGNPFSQAVSRVTITQNDLDKIKSITNVTDVIPMYIYPVALEFNNEIKGIQAFGVDPTEGQVFIDMGYYEIVDGRWLEDSDSSSVVIGEKLAKEGFDKEINLRKLIVLNGIEYKVVGVIKNLIQTDVDSANLVMMSVNGIKKLAPNIGPAETWVRVNSSNDVKKASDKMKEYFDDKYGERSVYVITSDQLLEQVGSIFGLITLFLVGIGSISLVVGGVGIMNAMVTSVVERTKEIGILKALGASNSKILLLFILEAAFIGAIGGIIGITIGYILSIIVSIIAVGSGFPLQAAITWQITLGALAFSMIIGMVSGILPAKRAADMDPIEALRYD
jgi:putative ABC transport system permease protein